MKRSFSGKEKSWLLFLFVRGKQSFACGLFAVLWEQNQVSLLPQECCR
ncbi:hypothetical protein HMPREF1141_1850 [Clostridium sp. MSTE9]|jgi:hypothetical protein|nr:hypothetical protein HMPREF1141_1850 [Clostridium sp. MSTE9]